MRILKLKITYMPNRQASYLRLMSAVSLDKSLKMTLCQTSIHLAQCSHPE